jgi:hypothetical protein
MKSDNSPDNSTEAFLKASSTTATQPANNNAADAKRGGPAAEQMTVNRDGLPPISFRGEQIGSGSSRENDSTCWQEVAIYRTRAGKYVVQVSHITCWQGEASRNTARSFTSAAEAVTWLRNPDAMLSAAAQSAVEDAAKSDDAFAAAWVEEVD